jgi:PilZ domain
MTKSNLMPREEPGERRSVSGVQRVARAAPRSDLERDVLFENAGSWHDGVARNMSLGGMFIATSAPAAFGGTVMVDLDLGLDAPTRVRCFVRWTNDEGMGVQFDVMGARETHALTSLLKI